VRLTDAGRVAVKDAAPKVAEADARILALVPGAKRDAFLKTLRDMARAAGKGEAGETGGAKKDKKAKAEKPPKGDKKKKKKKSRKKDPEASAANAA
jgi:hypothetical protein